MATRDIPGITSLSSSTRFALKSRLSDASPVNVPAGSRKAIDYPSRDGIYTTHHDNRNCLGRLLGCADAYKTRHDKHINLDLDEFRYKAGNPIQLAFSISVLDQNVLSFT
jgi:hypothetical protein